MSGLRDPRLEIFAREYARLKAEGMPVSQAAVEAAVEAKYKGHQNPSKTFAANARKKAQREDVKKRVEFLLAPKTEQAERQIEATKEWTNAKLVEIAAIPIVGTEVKTSDKLTALHRLAELNGWYPPQKVAPTNPAGDGPAILKFERIERVIVDPSHTHGQSLPTSA